MINLEKIEQQGDVRQLEKLEKIERPSWISNRLTPGATRKNRAEGGRAMPSKKSSGSQVVMPASIGQRLEESTRIKLGCVRKIRADTDMLPTS